MASCLKFDNIISTAENLNKSPSIEIMMKTAIKFKGAYTMLTPGNSNTGAGVGASWS